jgi:CrcB protein
MLEIIHVSAITIGAVAGALARYYFTEWARGQFGPKFPYGTFIINVTGCLAMGFFFTLSQGITGYPQELDLLVRTGFLGSYTTFSTYGFDTLALWRNHRRSTTMFYWAGSAVLGLIAVILGATIAHFLVK